MADGNFTLGPGESTGGTTRTRQCRAYWVDDEGVVYRCDITVLEGTTHSCDHGADSGDGKTRVRWGNLVARTRERAQEESLLILRRRSGQVVADASEALANPDRTQVGNGSARLGQVGGDHYRKFKIQPWDVIDEYGLGFYAGNALKYLLRAGRKGGILEDLRKCRHYLDKLIEVEEGRDGSA